jgi:hypothetical protein
LFYDLWVLLNGIKDFSAKINKQITMSSKQIIITDPTIIAYYEENENIDIVTMNHIFIDILKTLSTNLSETINSTINSKVLNLVTEINSNLATTKLDLMMKLLDSKREYIEDIKTIVNTSTLSNNEKINAIIEKNNDSLLSKTTQKLMEINSKDAEKMMTSIQQPIFSYINSSEERTNTNLAQLKDSVSHQNVTQSKLSLDINDFLGKYKNNSQFKGAVAETDLYYMLQSIMPTDEIIKVSGSTATCDFKVNRQNKQKSCILFESKDYTQSVPSDEVSKFERDVQMQKHHGIMVSQRSPITYKNPFQIDIINGLIHIYIPSADYNTEKVKIAIDIIDNLDMRLKNLESVSDDGFVKISKIDSDDIAEEYRQFGFQKSQMLDTIKSINKQLVDKLDEIQLPKIKQFLVKTGNIENDNGFKCTFCRWSGKNKASLGAHVRNCKSNPKNVSVSSSDVIEFP